MDLNLSNPDFEDVDPFLVAGLARRGPPAENHRGVWTDFEDRVEELADLTTRDEIYGVTYEYDESSGTFTYVAGVPIENPGQMAPEVTIVEVPASTYAVFESSIEHVESVMEGLTDEWSDETGYRRVDGPMFERFPADADPSDPETPATFYVPVEAM